MRVSKLIEELQKYPPDANARAYEGEVCGVIVEASKFGALLGVIVAHESEPAPSGDTGDV